MAKTSKDKVNFPTDEKGNFSRDGIKVRGFGRFL